MQKPKEHSTNRPNSDSISDSGRLGGGEAREAGEVAERKTSCNLSENKKNKKHIETNNNNSLGPNFRLGGAGVLGGGEGGRGRGSGKGVGEGDSPFD